MLVFMAILFIDLILLLIMFVVDPYTSKFIQNDPDRPLYAYNECYFENPNHVGIVISTVLATFKFLLLIIGIICTFLIRKVKYIHLNESKWIAYSTYNLFFSIIIVFVLQFALTQYTDRTILFVVRSIFIIWPIFATEVLIFFPKFYFYLRGKDTSQRIKHSNNSSSMRTTDVSSKKSSKEGSSNVSSKNLDNDDIEHHRRYISKQRRISKLEKALNTVRELNAEAKVKRRNYKKIEAMYLERVMKLKENQ